MKKPKKKTGSACKAAARPEPGISEIDPHLLEFHRQALALLPAPNEPRPGIAIISPGPRPGMENRTCSCSRLSPANCAHVKKLDTVRSFYRQTLAGKSLEEDFRASVWHPLAEVMAAGCKESCQGISFAQAKSEAGVDMLILDHRGAELLRYQGAGPDASRLLGRCLTSRDGGEGVPQRFAILNQLLFLSLSESEKQLLAMGSQSRRHALETSFWFRFAYHCYREFGRDGVSLTPAVNEESGAFTVAGRDRSGALRFRMIIPRPGVKELLAALREFLPNGNSLPIHPIPLKSIFKVSLTTELDLDLRPQIELIQAEGERRFFERADLEKFRYGDLVYVRELGVLAELERPDAQRQFRTPIRVTLKGHQIPGFIEEMDRDRGRYQLDETVRSLRIIKEAQRVEIEPQAIDRDWCWLSIRYGFGDSSVSLAEVLAARQAGERYINTPEGWLDCQSEYFDKVAALLGPEDTAQSAAGEQRLKLRRLELLRLNALEQQPVTISGESQQRELLEKLFNLQPPEPLPPIAGLASTLRGYQSRGVEWLMFLHENDLGGLLCDDMGLGKTHQVMALLLLLRGWKKISAPFLVVCPTTVLSHWQAKLQAHAPGLKAIVYHGGDRQLTENGQSPDVVLTSYGILWRDLVHLQQMGFALAIFDEMQHIKNPATRTYEAARDLTAGMKLGLTGTPIENRLADLKALLDLTAPGYLGSDEDFNNRYAAGELAEDRQSRRQELSRLIAPFTLRRRKQTVLAELPAKIEDIMTCQLSEQQVALYRQAIASRGNELLAMLAEDQQPVPYMHIFALLSLLKQICNHPALVEDKPELYEEYQSGKFELFQELLSEALDSGQKVVIFSQYLGMIEIIERYLAAQGVTAVSLTGASRNRGELIARFNDDSDCRVFVGSLRAGGTGIDLVAASVVIHYDRWWNAAREDQATDRVHRIGQSRGVQVFKLVTEGTLEEKISAIIAAKRNLLDEVIAEDHPDQLKTFRREELMELLAIRP